MVYGAISADVVKSTTLSAADIQRMQKFLTSFLSEVEERFAPSVWGRIVRGDGLEFVSDNPNLVFTIALLLKCYVKFFPAADNTSADFKRFGVRISIGIGSLRIFDPQNGIIDGDAIYGSGRGLLALEDLNRGSMSVAVSNHPMSKALDMLCLVIDALLNNATRNQCKILYYKMLKMTEKEVAAVIGKSQSSVNQSLMSVSWPVISKALAFFESLTF